MSREQDTCAQTNRVDDLPDILFGLFTTNSLRKDRNKFLCQLNNATDKRDKPRNYGEKNKILGDYKLEIQFL